MKQEDKKETKMNEHITKMRWSYYNSEYRSNIFSFGNMFLLTTSQDEIDTYEESKPVEEYEMKQQVTKQRLSVTQDLKERLIMTNESYDAEEVQQME